MLPKPLLTPSPKPLILKLRILNAKTTNPNPTKKNSPLVRKPPKVFEVPPAYRTSFLPSNPFKPSKAQPPFSPGIFLASALGASWKPRDRDPALGIAVASYWVLVGGGL